MRNRSRVVPFVLALLALAVLTSCTPTEPTPVADNTPTQSCVISGGQNNTCTIGNGNNPSASPSPGSGGPQVVFGEKVAEFGETGCANPAEANPRETRVGCNSAVTCSPTDVNGTVIKREDVSNFVQLVYFKQLGGTGAGRFTPDDNSFNGHVVCTTTGVVVLECSLKDLATGKITKGGDGGTSETPWTMNCVG